MDQQSFSLLQLVVSIIGSGLGTTGVGLLFNRKFSHDLEVQKAFLARASNVHTRAVNTLAELYRHLLEAQALMQRMTSRGRMAGEISPQGYVPLVSKAMDAARDVFLSGRLFIPPALAKQCDGYFAAVFEGQHEFAFAHLPQLDPAKQAEFWDKGAAVAFEKVPKLLEEIEKAARLVIHGDPS